MKTEEITTQILIEIRDRLDATNARLDKVHAELVQTRSDLGRRIDQTNSDLGRRIDQTNRQLLATEVRLATEISALRASVNDVRTSVDDVKTSVDEVKTSVDELKGNDMLARLERVERDVAELRLRASP